MGAPLREPRAPKSPNGAKQVCYSLTDLGELVPWTPTSYGNSNGETKPCIGTPPIDARPDLDHVQAPTSAEVQKTASTDSNLDKAASMYSMFGSMSPRADANPGSPDHKLESTFSSPRAASGSPPSSPRQPILEDAASPSQSFRTLHASAKGLLRTHPIATEQQLYEAFCGRKIVDFGQKKSRISMRVSRFRQAEGIPSKMDKQAEEDLDWVLAISVPAPGVRQVQNSITRAHAEAIFRTCFKGEEYEQSNTAFSLQSEAASKELRSFMRAFSEMPDCDDKGFKSMNVNRRMSQDQSFKHIFAEGDEDSVDVDELPEKYPRSFTCLVRNAIVTKLVLHCGLKVKLIPSEDRQQVILLISCSHYELLREADRQSLPTELDVHAADPVSLEPCTDTMIPLLYWFHSATKGGETGENADNELHEALKLLISRRREALERLPARAQAFHQNSTEFWETLRGFADLESGLALTKKQFKVSHESFISLSKSSSWSQEDVDPVPHFGSKVKAAQAKEAFLQYMKAMISDPLCNPDKVKAQVNREQRVEGRVLLRNYYEQLGANAISAHAGFEVGTYFGAEASTQRLWRHFSVRTLPPPPGKEKEQKLKYEKHIATPFKNHQIIKLIVDIISRQMDIGRLIDLGFVNSLFPLDSRDKVEEPEPWVVESEDSGLSYWFNVDTNEVAFDVPEELKQESHHRRASSLIKAWGFPPKDLPTPKRGLLFLYSFFVWPCIQRVRDYYGEEIALYFSLTQHLTCWCLVPAILGVFTGFMEPVYEGESSLAAVHLIYGIVISVWGSLWLEAWKRKEAQLAAAWGLLGITEEEVLRPAFEGVSRRSPIDFENDSDRVEAFCCRYGRVGRFPRQIVSAAILLFMALVHNVMMVLLLHFRGIWVEKGWGFVRYSNLVIATLFAVQMILFSFIVYRACVVLNRWENYRTHGDFTKAFIIKQCGLEFVNQFGIFFYIGLMKGAVDGCIVNDPVTDTLVRTPIVDISTLDNIEQAMCSQELRDAVKNVLLAFAFMNIIEITLPAFILPKLRATVNEYLSFEADPELKRGGSAEDQGFVGWTMSKIVQAMLNKEVYSTVEASGTYDDYIEVIVFFGHVSMFSVVFPFSPLIVLVLLIVEIRVDGHKLFHTLRRPIPKHAGSIGAWYYIFQFITWVSVITNSLILTWGMEENTFHWLKNANASHKWLFTLCIILGLVIFKAVIIVGVPDQPGPLKTLLLHHDWVCQQLAANNVAIGPRHIDVTSLDTHIHSCFSEQRENTVDFGIGDQSPKGSTPDLLSPTWFGRGML